MIKPMGNFGIMCGMRKLRGEVKKESVKALPSGFSAAVKDIKMTEKFGEFLANAMRFEPEEKREQIVADAEGMMTDFIRKRVDPSFALYAASGKEATGDWYLEIRTRLSSDPSLAEGFDVARLKAALKHYADFVRSKAFSGKGAESGHAGRVTLPDDDGHAGRVTIPDDDGHAGRVTIPDDDGHAGRVTLPDDVTDLSEGALTQVSFTKHERNPALRQLCLQHFGTTCQACGMDFEAVYGAIGKGYVEVHHLSPISQTDGEHAVDPTKDLVPLCANCHAMIHRLMAAEKGLEGAAALEKLKGCLKK